MSAQSIANPAPLGLLGFGLTTILLNLHNVGLFPVASVIMGMGIFYGGIAQIIAGIFEMKKGNTFGATAFISYGFFWISLVTTWILPTLGLAEASSPAFMGSFLFLWGLFTAGFAYANKNNNFVSRFVFNSLTVLFMLLAARDFTGSAEIGVLAGIVGLICGATAFYEGIAILVNEKHGKTVMPLEFGAAHKSAEA